MTRYRIVCPVFSENWRVFLRYEAAEAVARNADGHHPLSDCAPHRVEEVPDDPS